MSAEVTQLWQSLDEVAKARVETIRWLTHIQRFFFKTRRQELNSVEGGTHFIRPNSKHFSGFYGCIANTPQVLGQTSITSTSSRSSTNSTA